MYNGMVFATIAMAKHYNICYGRSSKHGIPELWLVAMVNADTIVALLHHCFGLGPLAKKNKNDEWRM